MEEKFIELDVSKIRQVPSDTETPVHNNPIQAKRPLCTNFPENSTILDKTEAISTQQCITNIPEYVEELEAIFNPLDVEECNSDLFANNEYTIIDNAEDLQKYLSELLIRFDTSPRNYTKEDYLYLLTVLYKSLLFIYKKEIKTITLGQNLSKIAHANDHYIELDNPVATETYIVENTSTTLPSIKYLNKYYILRWEEF